MSEAMHDRRELFDRAQAAPVPSHVLRAESFINLHYEQPISIEDLTKAASISIRALQSGFRKYRGTTPMNYLKEVRLEQTNKLLTRYWPPEKSVTTIALDCGFTHLGKFSRSYKDKFGESPSETLKR
jgi:transcriptional regulator GlxA family with amidase domain